jgi:type IV secretory pathway VirB3-like protein
MIDLKGCYLSGKWIIEFEVFGLWTIIEVILFHISISPQMVLGLAIYLKMKETLMFIMHWYIGVNNLTTLKINEPSHMMKQII